ncbi:Ig-like domain-containing protein [Pseudocitrobacter faecalis]
MPDADPQHGRGRQYYQQRGSHCRVTLSGTTNAEVGQTVTVSVGNQTLGTALVLAGGIWSMVVDASTLAQGSHDLTIAVTDKAGNSTSLEHSVLIDTIVPTITLDSLTADNVLNATEAGQAQVISGSSTGAAAGDKVVVTLGITPIRPSWTAAGAGASG